MGGDLTGAEAVGSNCLGGSGAHGKNWARITYELILVTNEYTACGDRDARRATGGESACAERRAGAAAGGEGEREGVRRAVCACGRTSGARSVAESNPQLRPLNSTRQIVARYEKRTILYNCNIEGTEILIRKY
jgi:hypothetical protein